MSNSDSGSLDTLKAIFPSWADDDLLLVLSESKGSLEEAATKISEGEWPVHPDVELGPVLFARGRPTRVDPHLRSSSASYARAEHRPLARADVAL